MASVKKYFLIGLAIVSSMAARAGNMDPKEDAKVTLQWCNEIYHRNSSCPGYGQVHVPKHVLDEERAEDLKFCDRIYQQNPVCPKYGKVKVPDNFRIKWKKEHLDWCNRINHENPRCPGHGNIFWVIKGNSEKAKEAFQRWALCSLGQKQKCKSEFEEWCDSINHMHSGCPAFDEAKTEDYDHQVRTHLRSLWEQQLKRKDTKTIAPNHPAESHAH